LSKVGLARRLKITEDEAQKLMNNYFKYFSGVKIALDRLAKEAIANKFSKSVIGRKRYYDIPSYDHPDYGKITGAVRRQGMNSYMQQSNADTIKQASILLKDRLDKSGYDAKFILIVHDEVVVEVRNDQIEPVKHIVEESIRNGFDMYFDLIKMETDALVGPCWLKSKCEAKIDNKKCGCSVMQFTNDVTGKFKNKLICSKCGSDM
jgi:DNA polymerase-1